MTKKGNETIGRRGSKASNCLVIGIGASAGGLEALQLFFSHMPENLGVAFVVVQHLSPDYKSLMDELLARYTRLSIKVIEDKMEVEPGTIYLIPPRHNLELVNNQLLLSKVSPGTGLNLPIDVFFKSLAESRGKDAIGIILSGTGSDGTMGTRAIKEMNGMIMVQDEHTARFNGMPSSAISTGLVDYVLPPNEMGIELQNYLMHPLVVRRIKDTAVLPDASNALLNVLNILKRHTGTDFTYYKENTIQRRLERRISINRLNTIDEYITLLKDSDNEKNTLYREFLIGVTQFFRDKEAFEVLRKSVLPALFEANSNDIRVWSAGCSTGEEAYSMAILLMEAAEKSGFKGDIKIFASDIDKRAIDIAAAGFYPDSIIADIDPGLLAKFFTRSGDGYQVIKDVRNKIIFTAHNILKDPPFSRLDLIVCRNLFIYLKPEIQLKLLTRFYYSLNPSGILFMGSSETLGGMSDAFEVIDQKNKVYRHKPGYVSAVADHLVIDPSRNILQGQSNRSLAKGTQKNLTDSLLGEAAALFMPPTIITDKHDAVVSIINNINPYTEIQPGRYANDLYALLPKDLGLFVSNLIRQVKSGRSRISRNVSNLPGSTKGNLVIEVRKITWDGREYLLTSFQENDHNKDKISSKKSGVSDQENADLRLIDLEKELRNARENLAATIEELESANEELQSSNEELIASNEELQSTNEELQSVNEELYTVNTEHQQKIEELTQLNNDINNLLRNTEVAAVYLDNKLCIRKITPYATQITRIREGDIGRPVNHLSLMEGYKELPQDVERVIETLQPIDREITTKAGNSFFTRIRPYRTEHHAVDGILLTIIEITELDKLRRRADLAGRRLALSLNMGQMAWWEYEQVHDKFTFSENLNALLDIQPKHMPGNLDSLLQRIHLEDQNLFSDHLNVNSALPDHAWDITLRLLVGDGTYQWFRCTGELKKQADQSAGPVIYGLLIDIKDQHTLEEEINRHAELLDLIMEHSPVSTVMVDGDGWITYANKQAETLFGITRQQITARSYDASEWKITGLNGQALESHELPFALIKETLSPVKGFKHYIQIPPAPPRLLCIDGVPVVSSSGRFEGAVFSLTQIQDENAT